MALDDAAIGGHLPVAMGNGLGVKRLTDENQPALNALMQGLHEALAYAEVANVTGETAIMQHTYTYPWEQDLPEELIGAWEATALSIGSSKLVLQPRNTIQPGMLVVGIQHDGYGCNGGTALTNIVRSFGSLDAIAANAEAMEFIRMLTIPCQIYTPMLTRLFGWKNGIPESPRACIVGAAHITGGGFKKLGEILPENCVADLHTMPHPPEVLYRAQKLSQGLDLSERISDKDGYTSFNGGVRLVLVCKTLDDLRVIQEVAQECGIDKNQVCVIGTIIPREDDKAQVQIVSKYGQSFSEKVHI